MIESVFASFAGYYESLLSPSNRVFPLYLMTSLGLAFLAYWQIERAHAAEHDSEEDSDKTAPDRPGFLQFMFDPRIIFHSSTRQDVKFFLVNSFIYYALISQFLISVHVFSTIFYSLLTDGFGEVSAPVISSGTGLVLYTIMAAIAVDLGVFIMHSLFHRVPVLWEFHKVHHSAEELTPFTVFRMHPVDLFLTGLLVAVMNGLAFAGFFYLTASEPASIAIFGLNIVFFLFYLTGYNLRHTHVWVNYPFWLSRILVSPAQHQIHHSSDPKHFDKNMGLIFSFWDQLMGTSYIPREREHLKFGITREEPNPFKSVTDLYVKPFVWAGEILRETITSGEGRQKALIAGFLIAGITVLGQLQYRDAVLASGPGLPSVRLAKLTWTEIESAIQKGYRTVIIPTGGTEQNGPFMILGKHRLVVGHTSQAVARKLGKTFVAPVMDYVPEGDVVPKPSGHMRFAGTLTIPDSVFEGVLEYTARSLKAHGFREIYFLGDSGPNQLPQERVARKLMAEWGGGDTRVASLDKYYAANGQFAALQKAGYSDAAIGWHAGMRDTSEVLAIEKQGIRLSTRNIIDRPKMGYSGAPGRASAKIGRMMLALKVRAAVAQVQALRAASKGRVRKGAGKIADASGG